MKLDCPAPQPMPKMNEREWQYAWERGQIDYLGMDSFDNIKAKIETTLSNGGKRTTPEKEEPKTEGITKKKPSSTKPASSKPASSKPASKTKQAPAKAPASKAAAKS